MGRMHRTSTEMFRGLDAGYKRTDVSKSRQFLVLVPNHKPIKILDTIYANLIVYSWNIVVYLCKI